MGQAPSTPFAECLTAVCDGRRDCVAFANNPAYAVSWAAPYNLDLPVEPVAVTRPQSAEDVSGFVKCAASHGVKVQPKSGGHSYANYGLGGENGALAIDLRNLQDFSMDTSTWRATIGGGTRLSDVTQRLHDHGKRAIAHGTCPDVGIGGHATIGGLGPSSRMWGSCLDHVLEVEVVTADGTIQRASEDENSDLFFALKGAGAGFGIITEFVVRTQPEPGSVVSYAFTLSFDRLRDLGPLLTEWQSLAADPGLDRRFGTELVWHELGAVVTATFHGTEEEFAATGIPARLPGRGGRASVTVDGWLGAVAGQAETAALRLSGLSTAFAARSLAFRADQLLSPEAAGRLAAYVDGASRGTAAWFLIFDASGGAVADVEPGATAYAHRDKVVFAQAYGVGIPALNPDTRAFVDGMVASMRNATDTTLTTYPGYVDPTLPAAQESYWGDNLPRLAGVKARWDPLDVFHNPQSVRGSS